MGKDAKQGTSRRTYTPGRRPPAFTKEDALLDAKDETIALLHDQLEAERQDRAEERRVLVSLIEHLMEREGKGRRGRWW
jgi:hypothetical protein